MSRLLDRALHAGLLGRVTNDFRRDAEVIEFSNVAEYFFSFRREGGWDIRKDFPNLAPPFPVFWMETKAPPYMVDPDGQKRALPLTHWGFQCFGVPFDTVVRDVYATFCPVPLEHAKWIFTARLFTAMSKTETYGPLFEWHFPLNEEGELAIHQDGEPHLAVGIPGDSSPDVDYRIRAEEEGMTTLLMPALLTLSFMHCRNTVLIDNEPPAPLSKKHLKKTGYPLVRYKTLQIESVKRVLAQHGRLETEGLRQALHICRGHFKVFDDKPLFGKYKGMWWWDAQVRGTAPRFVLKDYEVKP